MSMLDLQQKGVAEKRKGGKVDFDQLERDEAKEKARLEDDML